MNKDQNLEKVIAKRNKRLERFFNLLFEGTDIEFRIIGDKNCPAVIVNEEYCLSCYVHNFDLHFTNMPQNGEIVYSVKLQHNQQMDKEKLYQILEETEHRKVYKIEYGESGLFLAGYNFLDKENCEGRYPVFSRNHPKIYFDKTYAESIVADYEQQDYNLRVK